MIETFDKLKQKLLEWIEENPGKGSLFIGNHRKIENIPFTINIYIQFIEAIPKQNRKNSANAKKYKEHLQEIYQAIQNNQFKNDLFGGSKYSIYPLKK
jgi:ABC-type Zn uptake system ZnuABC Zn-binding protein ZnuA